MTPPAPPAVLTAETRVADWPLVRPALAEATELALELHRTPGLPPAVTARVDRLMECLAALGRAREMETLMCDLARDPFFPTT